MKKFDYKLLFEKALLKGIKDIKVNYSSSSVFSISYYDGEMNQYYAKDGHTITIEGLFNNQLGTFATNNVSNDLIDEYIDCVIESASYQSSQDEFIIYEGDKKYPKYKHLFNKSLFLVDPKEKIEVCRKLDELYSKEENVIHRESSYGEGSSYMFMATSKGLFYEERTNSYSFGGSIVYMDKGDIRRGGYSIYENDFNKIDLDYILKESLRTAKEMIGAKTIKSGNYEAVFSEEATGSLLGSFSSMFSSDAINKNLSPLKNRLGDIIASNKVTIVDNPFVKNSLNTFIVDTDGVRTKYLELVKNGKLVELFYNLKTAKKENRESTGNACGTSCEAHNIYFKEGKKTKDELIKEIDNGIYIESLSGLNAGLDPQNGDFSLQADGFKIENHMITSPITLFTVSGNFLDLLKNITGVSNELKKYIESTAIKVSEIAVSGE